MHLPIVEVAVISSSCRRGWRVARMRNPSPPDTALLSVLLVTLMESGSFTNSIGGVSRDSTVGGSFGRSA